MAHEQRSFSSLLLPIAAAVALFLFPTLRPKPLQDSIPALQAQVRRDPTDPTLQARLGRLLVETGHYPEAIAAFRASLRYDPANVPASCGLATALYAQDPKNLLQARSILELSLAQHPGNGDLSETLGDLLMQSQNKADLQTAINCLIASLKQNPARLRAALWMSKFYEESGDLRSAEFVLLAPRKVNDRSSELHLQLARILSLEGKTDLAIAEFNAGTARDAANAQAYANWGLTLLAANRPEAAQRLIEKALELEPNNPAFHVYLSRSLWQQARFTDAQQAIQTALDKNPAFIPAFVELASDYESLNSAQGRAAAEAVYQKAILLAPRDSDTRLRFVAFLTKNPGEDARQKQKSRQTMAALLIDGVNLTDDPQMKIRYRIAAANSYSELGDNLSAEDLIQANLDYADHNRLEPDMVELLLQLRQKYRIAQYPSVASNLTPYLAVDPTLPSDSRTLALVGLMLRYAIHGTTSIDPVDRPWPSPLQPRMDALMDKPMDLSQIPGPGNALDPALYVGLKPFVITGAF